MRYGVSPVTRIELDPVKQAVGAWIIALLLLGGMVAAIGAWVTICFNGCVWPFDETWSRRQEVVEMVLSGEREAPFDSGTVRLPDEYRDLADGGEVIVQRDSGSVMIVFWREGEMHGHRVIVYSTSEVVEGPFLDTCAVVVHPQGGSWYEVGLLDVLPAACVRAAG